MLFVTFIEELEVLVTIEIIQRSLGKLLFFTSNFLQFTDLVYRTFITAFHIRSRSSSKSTWWAYRLVLFHFAGGICYIRWL